MSPTRKGYRVVCMGLHCTQTTWAHLVTFRLSVWTRARECFKANKSLRFDCLKWRRQTKRCRERRWKTSNCFFSTWWTIITFAPVKKVQQEQAKTQPQVSGAPQKVPGRTTQRTFTLAELHAASFQTQFGTAHSDWENKKFLGNQKKWKSIRNKDKNVQWSPEQHKCLLDIWAST